MSVLENTFPMPRRLALRQASLGTGEIPDKTPVEVSIVPAPLTLREEMRRFVIQQVSERAHQVGQETFAEADDFDVEEEDDLTSPYTVRTLVDPEGRPDDLEGSPNEADQAHLDAAKPAKPTDSNGKSVEPPPAAPKEEPRRYTAEEWEQRGLTPDTH